MRKLSNSMKFEEATPYGHVHALLHRKRGVNLAYQAMSNIGYEETFSARFVPWYQVVFLYLAATLQHRQEYVNEEWDRYLACDGLPSSSGTKAYGAISWTKCQYLGVPRNHISIKLSICTNGGILLSVPLGSAGPRSTTARVYVCH